MCGNSFSSDSVPPKIITTGVNPFDTGVVLGWTMLLYISQPEQKIHYDAIATIPGYFYVDRIGLQY